MKTITELLDGRDAALASFAAAVDTIHAQTTRCTIWNDSHDCGLPEGHAGDHECAGCRDLWNRDPFEAEDCADPFFIDQRDEDRCTDQP